MAAAAKIQYGRFHDRAVSWGFNILYPAEEQAPLKIPIKFEVVAIPGLGTKDEDFSWTLNKTHWLRDTNMLQRRVPNARISVFLYYQHWFEKGSVSQRLDNVADRLVKGLDRLRRANDTKTAIIFVCHSLGGIILEKALLKARLHQIEYPYVFPWVAGSIFLGTPFRGITEPRALVLAELAESIGMGAPSDFLKFLEKDSEMLRSLLEDFTRLARDAQLRLYCFFEQHESDRIRVAWNFPMVSNKREELIVDKISATIDYADALGLKADHFGLNKYEGSKDPNFTYVSEEIRIATQQADGILKARQNALRQALVDDRTYRNIINHLRKGFQDIDAAINGSYKGAKGNKLSSVLDSAAFTDWIQRDTNQLLWVHGKAGTGQAAVASSAIEFLEPSRESGSIVASFYCDQSDTQRRSLKGLFQLIIHQIIESNRDLAVHLLSDSKKTKEVGKPEFDPEMTLKVQILWDALHSMAKDLPTTCIYIIIHGLEQLSEDSLDGFLTYLREFPDTTLTRGEFRSTAPLKFMLLSRTGRPNIEETLKSRASEIDLQDEGNIAQVSDDLKAYISVNVNSLLLPSSLAYLVKRQVHSRAEDNEIYVTLVMQELKNAWIPGETQHVDIRKLLESFPYGLTNLFEYVRNRVLHPQAEGLEYTKEILRCRIAAYVAPTMRELAVMAGLPKEDRDDLQKLKVYIVRCGAFFSLRGGEWDLENNTVEWIDVSAQEHLQRQATDLLELDLEIQHGIIALRSLEYIHEVLEGLELPIMTPNDEGGNKHDFEPHKSEHSDDSDSNEVDDSDSSGDDDPSTGDIPNRRDGGGGDDKRDGSGSTGVVALSISDSLGYPVRYWVEHAKRAPSDVLNELNLKRPFWQEDSRARQEWWRLIANVHAKHQQGSVSALHVAVILDFPALVEFLLEHNRNGDVHKSDSFGFQPLYYACENGNAEVVKALLETGADINHTDDESQPAALHAAASNQHREIVKMLIDRKADVDATSKSHGTALYAAIANQDDETMQLLLSHGAQVNIIGGVAQRALNIGASVGYLEGVRTLISHGADIDPEEDYWYGSALGGASRAGHADVVKYLLSEHWSSSRSMKTYGSFLTAAATYNHLDVVKILLEREDRVPVLEQALCAAAQRGFASIAREILTRNTTLRHHKAFSLAAYYGRAEVLTLLFERDESRELRNDPGARDDALYTATDNEHEKTVELLLSYNADPNAEGPTYGFALAASAYDGTTKIMEALIAKGADVNKRGGEYGTALQESSAAAYRGKPENVKLLLDHGALLNTPAIGIYGNELQAAVFTGNEDTIRLLLKHNADVNAFGGRYSHSIIAAVDRGNSTVTRILLEHNAHVNVRGGEDNWPVVCLAAFTLHKADLRLIMKTVADINATCDRGTTALINCADAGDTKGLRFLLDNGADVNIISETLGSALHAAAAIGDEDCCKILLRAGADVNAVGGEFGTAIQAAASADDIETVRVLLAAGADLSGTTASGTYGTALEAAAAVGSFDVVEELLKQGAVVNVRPAIGTSAFGSALSAAISGRSYTITKLLVDHGSDINFEGGYHHLPIMAAAQSGDATIVRLLLEHGADARASGGMWGSAITAAAYGNSKDIIELLTAHGADVRQTGGKYGSALSAAVVKADIAVVDLLIDRALELVNFRGGKYHTALIAAAYFDRLDVLTKLLDSMADIRYQGGQFRSTVTAAAIRGNKAILEKLLKMNPPGQLLDEALVEACAHRQSTSVDLLLKHGADIKFRHSSLGLPADALRALQANDENSDDEAEDAEPSDNEKENVDESTIGGDDHVEEVWEGDNVAIPEEIEEGSVTDLQLEDEPTEEAKILEMLDKAILRCKRNPTVKRFRTVKHRHVLRSLSTGVPPIPQLPRIPVHKSYHQPAEPSNFGTPYGQHSQEPWSLPFNVNPVQDQQPALHAQPINSLSSAPDFIAYPTPLFDRKQVQSPVGYQRRQSPQNAQQQYPFPPSQPEKQYSTGSVPNLPSRSFTPPSRKGSEDHALKRQSKAVNRRSVANLAQASRYQQRQSSQPAPPNPMDRSIARQDFAGASELAAFPIAEQQHPPVLPPRPSQSFVEPQQPYHQTPPVAQYPIYSSSYIQEQTHMPSDQVSQIGSPASSLQSNQYVHSTPHTGHSSFAREMPTSSDGATSRTPDAAQARKWGGGGYDGEGYGQ